MNSILITGCNRGLGLGLIKNLMVLPTPPAHVFATCRNLQKAEVGKLYTQSLILCSEFQHFHLPGTGAMLII